MVAITFAALGLVALVASHNRSEGTSRFVVDASGRVDVVIGLIRPDLPELCDVDLAIVDPARHAAMEERLDACVARGLPSWLRLRVDDASCRVLPGAWRVGEGLAVTLSTQALCDPPAGRVVTIDWGLFRDAPLEHVSTATLVLPDGATRRALLSRRHNRMVTRVAAPLLLRALPVVAALVAIVAGGAALVVWSARRRRAERPG